MILGATMSVAVEEVQKDRYPRIDLKLPVTVEIDGRSVPAQMLQFSQEGVRVGGLEGPAGADPFAGLPDGAKLSVVLPDDEGASQAFPAHLAPRDPGKTDGARDLIIDFPDDPARNDEKRFNRVTFARRGIWARTPETPVDDRFITGFLELGRLALYGYRSMIEFLPGRTLPAVRGLITSLLPRTLSSDAS